jgi:hypothetical protein
MRVRVRVRVREFNSEAGLWVACKLQVARQSKPKQQSKSELGVSVQRQKAEGRICRYT